MHKTLKKRWRMIKLEVNPNFLLKIIDLVLNACTGCELPSSIRSCRISVHQYTCIIAVLPASIILGNYHGE